MGLDLTVEGCPKPGHEQEWRDLLERSFADEELSPAEVARFQEIVIPAHERVGAPRVGFDQSADDWIIEAKKAKTPEQVAAVLKEFHGYYALRLAQCDGVPMYSSGGFYEGADETSFRGAFLKDCSGVLSKQLRDDAWNHKFPEQAIAYGKALLAAAHSVEQEGTPANQRRPTLLSRLGITKQKPTMPISEQLDIVRAAGRWFVFWGERGHAIRAWN